MVEIQVDGASRGNPGLSGAGVVIKDGDTIHEYCFSLGNLSNHEAEFMAVILALRLCKENYQARILAFQSDSQVVVDAMEKNYVKNELFKPLLDEIIILQHDFPHTFIKWIPSEQNKHADRLAREAIQKQIKNM